MITAEVLAHSRNNHTGDEIVTFKTRFPKFILAEFNTHRVISRNSSSTRAIPVAKQIETVREDPFIPKWFGKNKKGMAASERMDGYELRDCLSGWTGLSGIAAGVAETFLSHGMHKQHSGRIIEPWQMVDHISTATTWGNFFRLRCHPGAQPEIQELAWKMLKALYESKPEIKHYGEWHIPFKPSRDTGIERVLKIATARCARISYKNFDGTFDEEKDIALCDSLLESRHMSPFEHCARAFDYGMYDNFRGWQSYRNRLGVSHQPLKSKESMKELLDLAPDWIWEE